MMGMWQFVASSRTSTSAAPSLPYMPSLGSWAPMHEYSHPSNIGPKHVQALCQGFPCLRAVPMLLWQHRVAAHGMGRLGGMLLNGLSLVGKLRLILA